MRNVKIEGGRDVGPPKSWNTETDGECLTLSVLFHDAILPRLSSRTTAWQFTPEELDALANGGHFFLSPRLPFVPVMSLWVQDAAGKVIGELRASASPGEPEEDGVRPENSDKERARADRAVMVAGHLRAGIIAIGRELDKALGINRATPASDWPALDNAGIIARLAEVARSPFMSGKRADFVLHDDIDSAFWQPVDMTPKDGPKIKGKTSAYWRINVNPDAPPWYSPLVMGIDLAAPDKPDMTAIAAANLPGSVISTVELLRDISRNLSDVQNLRCADAEYHRGYAAALNEFVNAAATLLAPPAVKGTARG